MKGHDSKPVFEGLLAEIRAICGGSGPAQAKLASICDLLRRSVPWYDWVGFYEMDESGSDLLLGPFSGEPTEHVRIPVGRGICGQAAIEGRTLVIDDVSIEENYLSCSLEVKAEIVVPVFRGGRIVGELDIDSHSRAPFGGGDRAFLEEVASIVSDLLGGSLP